MGKLKRNIIYNENYIEIIVYGKSYIKTVLLDKEDIKYIDNIFVSKNGYAKYKNKLLHRTYINS